MLNSSFADTSLTISKANRTVLTDAKALNWPLTCACCGQPIVAKKAARPAPGDDMLTAADALPEALPAISTEEQGPETVRIAVADWDGPPYCAVCAHHTEKAGRAEMLDGWGTRAMLFVLGIIPFIGLGVLILTWLLSGSGATGFWVAVGACVLAALYAVGQKFLKMRDSKRLHEEAQAGVTPRCTDVGHAVVFEGTMEGTHSFIFRNPRYADLFTEANPEKVV